MKKKIHTPQLSEIKVVIPINVLRSKEILIKKFEKNISCILDIKKENDEQDLTCTCIPWLP